MSEAEVQKFKDEIAEALARQVADIADLKTRLRVRISDLERTRAVDAQRIAVLEADILELRTGR